MKRIGLFISTLNSGGAERVVSHLSNILSKNYDVHVILFEDTYMEYPCGGKVHSLDVPSKTGSPIVKLSLLWGRVKKLKDLIQQEQLDCVISFLDSPNFVNLFAKVAGCRKIISIRNYSGLENRQSGLGKLTDIAMKLLYRGADCVVTVSKLIEKDFCAHYGIPKKKICTIYNPYNFDEMRQKGDQPLTEAEQAFYDGHFVFANVGRIMYQKSVWHLVKAFSIVHAKHPDSRLVIVGEDLSDGKLTALIGQLGIKDSVLLTGRTRNPYQYLKNADCYVLASLFEGFPNAMVEAMACGCSIIAADCKSGPREILYENADLDVAIDEVTDADYGILIPVLEPDENWDATVITEGERKLAQAMERMLCDPKKCEAFAQSAIQRSCVFDYDAAREAFSRVIEG